MLTPNNPFAVTNVVQTATDLIGYLDGASGRGTVTPDGVDDRNGTTIREALEALRRKIDAFLGD